MQNENLYKELLRRFRLKVTLTRLHVLDVLANTPVALSHADITEQLAEYDIDKVTLYRTLNAFTKCGLAHKVATEDRNWLYALHMPDDAPSEVTSDHAHFVCDECERIYCLPMETGNNTRDIKEEQGFVIRSQEYRLHGTCPECHTQFSQQ